MIEFLETLGVWSMGLMIGLAFGWAVLRIMRMGADDE